MNMFKPPDISVSLQHLITTVNGLNVAMQTHEKRRKNEFKLHLCKLIASETEERRDMAQAVHMRKSC